MLHVHLFKLVKHHIELLKELFEKCLDYDELSSITFRSPISGLYLCGSGSHPGGGITCAPGVLGGEAILKYV